METADWFKLKRYPHIEEPLTLKDYHWVKEYVETPEKITKHSFLPLIHKCIVSRKYRADSIDSYRTKKGERRRLIGKPKVRDIYYSSHLDSVVFSYYNHLINSRYEELVRTKNFDKSIVAYRKLPVAPGSDNNKCNIDFAKSTFEFIQANKQKKLSAIVADVTSFFDNLDHKVLKKQWSTVLEKKTLPRDHYNVFKALTRLKYVEGDQLFNAYGQTMLVEKVYPTLLNLKN